MVLDGEQDEAVGVLLQQRLVGLLLPDCGSSGGVLDVVGLFGEIGDALDGAGDGVVCPVVVAGEVQLLGGRVVHVEVGNGRSSLQKRVVSIEYIGTMYDALDAW